MEDGIYYVNAYPLSMIFVIMPWEWILEWNDWSRWWRLVHCRACWSIRIYNI